ncbi:MAG: DNA polymerase III subunit [Thermogutta sp.]
MWHGIKGHDEIVERFRRAIKRGRIGGTYLFLGTPGIGKKLFALKLAQALLCERNAPEAFDPCEMCTSCLQVTAKTHPDVMIVSKPPDKTTIPLEILIGERGQRNTEGAGLIGHLALKPYSGRHRIGIIDDADYFNAEGANALLKTLEEPPAQAVLILIGTSASKQLPTIRSRSQIIRFSPLPPDVLVELLLEEGLAQDATDAERLAQLSDGSLDHARDLADAELWSFWSKWESALSQGCFDVVNWSQEFRSFVDSAGKEAVARRKRLSQLISFTAKCLQQANLIVAGAASPGGAFTGHKGLLQFLARFGQHDSEEKLRNCVEICLQACEEIERNANLTVLIDDWITTLWRCLNEAPGDQP